MHAAMQRRIASSIARRASIDACIDRMVDASP
jgi:hypothetical protein